MKNLLFVVLVLIVVVANYAIADDKEKQQNCSSSVAVGEQHKMLLEGVGNWTFIQEYWEKPGSKPLKCKGTSVVKKALDGRAIIVKVKSEMPNEMFQGIGIYTWNVIKKKYSAAWLDNYSYNGVDLLEGTYDAKTKTMTWDGEMVMPNGKKAPYKIIDRYLGKDKIIMEFYMIGTDGKLFMSMRNTNIRVQK